MRELRLRAWARCAISAAALAFAVGGLAPGASAEGKYQSLIVFGDSYADLTLSNQPASNPLAPPGLGLSVWNVYPVSLAAQLGITSIADVAVGGATASPTAGNPSTLIFPPDLKSGNLPDQVAAYLADNPSVGGNDLITINIGGNDIRAILENTLLNQPQLNLAAGYPNAVLTPLNAQTFASATTGYAVGAIDQLVGAGGKNFVLGAFSTFSGLPEFQATLQFLLQTQQIDQATAQFITAGADLYAQAYFDGLQLALAPYAQNGVRVFMFDLARLAEAVNANPTKYGFTGFICPQNGLEGLASAVCGATQANPTNNNPLQSQFYFGPDGLHLTNAGFDLVAQYMANIVMAPHTIGVQPAVVSTTTGGFVNSLQGRLDATRDAAVVAGLGGAPGAGGPMGLGATAKGGAGSSGFTSFALGTFLGGSRSESADLAGYDYESSSGTAGFEFRINRNLIAGVAANYTTTSADLRDGANIDLDAIQGSAYLSYATTQVFAEVLAAYGSHAVGLARPGVLPGDTIRSSTGADAYAVAARAGYLFDFGSLRAGPIAGLTYLHSRVDGYTETGDDLLTYNVSAQTLDALVGNVGIRFLAPFKTASGNFVVPHLNIMLEHQLGDDTRTLTASLTQAPLLPIPTALPNFESRTYGRIDGGITFQLGPDASAIISAGSTFARDEGEDYRISAGLNYRF
jgi:uncharacterized protein YhjY with autotransporter beta-barrel domain/phospholipase/lecithinase/hemolysin